MNAPMLSVIMSNYNHARYAGEALEAILSQSYGNIEVLLIDDASTDNSIEVIEGFAKKDSRVKFFRNERNMGLLFNQNKLVQLARGDYIYGAAADDKVLPGLFEKSMALLLHHPQAGLCCSDVVFLNDPAGVLSPWHFGIAAAPRYISPQELAAAMKAHFYIHSTTMIMKRISCLEAGSYMAELKWQSDWFLAHTVGLRSGICYIPEPLAIFRKAAGSYSTLRVRQWEKRKDILNAFFAALKKPEFRDVAPLFKYSNALPATLYGHRTLFFMLARPEYRHYLSFSLAWACILGSFQPHVPLWLQQVYLEWLRRFYRAGHKT